MSSYNFSRRVLLVVTGMSPQVVTESLYALAIKAEEKFIPTEIRIITTTTGAREARLNLLSEKEGKFYQLLADYQLDNIHLKPEYIHIIKDKSGQPLDDIRSIEDNESAADTITELVRDITSDNDCSLHVSIAGGRKTMGYYLGYALSLYGREQDQLSHVLVSSPYENNRAFYYPTPYEMPIRIKRGEKEQTYDAQDALIDLAKIPYVRLRDGLDEKLKTGKSSFSESVFEAQKALPRIHLSIDIDKKEVLAGGVCFKMPATELALYWLLMEQKKLDQLGFHWSLNVEGKLLKKYARIVGNDSGHYEKMEMAIKNGMTKDYINPIKTKVNKCIKKELGERMAKDYEIVSDRQVPGTRYKYYSLKLSADDIVLP